MIEIRLNDRRAASTFLSMSIHARAFAFRRCGPTSAASSILVATR
jgi:hypothetical protein